MPFLISRARRRDDGMCDALPEWQQFRALDLEWLRSLMVRPVIVDLRNIYRADEMRRAKFRYVGIGGAEVER